MDRGFWRGLADRSCTSDPSRNCRVNSPGPGQPPPLNKERRQSLSDIKVKDAPDHVRAGAQELDGAISDAAAKGGGAVKADLEAVAATHSGAPASATAVGVGVGALLGAMAGPAGAAVGAATAGVGALAGDADRADARHEAANKTRSVLSAGQSAVIADVSEDWTPPIDTPMRELGGIVYRRANSERQDDAWRHRYGPGSHLYPHAYVSQLSLPSRQSSNMFHRRDRHG